MARNKHDFLSGKFPVRRLRPADIAWLQVAGRLLMRGRAVRLGQWLVDWADQVELSKAFAMPPPWRHKYARPKFEEFNDGELADCEQVIGGLVQQVRPDGAAMLVDRIDNLLRLETSRRQRLMHVAMQTAGLKPGEAVEINGKVYFEPPEPESNTQGAER